MKVFSVLLRGTTSCIHRARSDSNSILLRSGLYPAWLFWLSTRFSCCLKMKSVENIFGYIREQFYRFSRGCKPRENLWNCLRKYPKMFETYFIFRQQNIEFKPMSGVIMLLCKIENHPWLQASPKNSQGNIKSTHLLISNKISIIEH